LLLGQDRRLRKYIPTPPSLDALRAGTDTLRRILTLHEQHRTAIARSARRPAVMERLKSLKADLPA
jgi:hypothetical protein